MQLFVSHFEPKTLHNAKFWGGKVLKKGNLERGGSMRKVRQNLLCGFEDPLTRVL